LTDLGERFVVVVSDAAPTTPSVNGPSANGPNTNGLSTNGAAAVSTGDVHGAENGAMAIPAGFGLAVISGLADDVHVSSTSSGVRVRMSWPAAAAADQAG
jgi:hypothetical protein